MQFCNDKDICDAHTHGRHFQSCFGIRICDAMNRISRWICDAAALADMHYTTECNLSCVTPKSPRFVLQNPHLDSGVGTFLLRIVSHHPSTRTQPLRNRPCAGAVLVPVVPTCVQVPLVPERFNQLI